MIPVTGWNHIIVFMAGHIMQGLRKSHARRTLKRRVSDIPALILAIISADAGATTTISAHCDRSICSTESPMFSQRFHSSSSVNTRDKPPQASNCFHMQGLYSFAFLKKCKDALLQIIRKSRNSVFDSSTAISGTFNVATEPEQHIRTRVTFIFSCVKFFSLIQFFYSIQF